MARVLVVDDEESVRNLVSRALSLHDHDVTLAVNGSNALERMSGEEFDLLLTDIVMPVMDGITLALKVSRDWPQTRILMMTGYAEEKRRAHNLDVLSHEVISKPFAIHDLIETVDKVLTEDRG
jgi:CheY-like chemotaxis protein